MRPLFDYLFYCFYCLTAKDKPDRAGASLSMLSLFLVLALLDIYTLAVGLLHLKSHFFIAGIGSMIVAQSWLHFSYIRPKTYEPLIVRYNQGEFNRLSFALIGVGLILTVMLLPFPILKASR
jgi:peptidoglycan biosynthesis protein MviN/MurJ (putative lipid II flippase)